MTVQRSLLLASAGALLTACALHPAATPPPQDVPTAFDGAGASAAQWPGQDWYRGLSVGHGRPFTVGNEWLT